MQKNSLTYCGDLVRRYEPDWFLLSLFAPAHAREDIWTLLAFNWEISKTRSVVSESTLGLIRLQWWRDEIKKIYEGEIIPAHEVLLPLSRVIDQHKLPKELFDNLIYAREFDLEDVLPGNLEGLMNYADFTTTPLLNLMLRVMGHDPAYFPLQPIAINMGISRILRAAPHHARQGRCYFPEDIMNTHNVTRDDFYNARKPQEFEKIVEKICTAHVWGIKPQIRLIRAYDALANIYFSQIKSLKYNVFSYKNMLPPPFLALRLTLKTMF